MPEMLTARLRRWVDLSSVEIDLLHNLVGKGLALKRDDCPILAHQRSQWAMLVLNGCAALFKDGESGRRTITEFVLPGELLPPTPFIDGSTAVGILSSSEVMLIPVQAYAGLRENAVLREALDWLE